MNWKYYISFSILGFLLLSLVSFLQVTPGYMDAEYYYAMGLRIVNERSLFEPFIWNYLNGIFSFPQPAFGFWMPLPSFLAALGLAITGWKGFVGAKIGFLLMYAFVPPLTMKLAFDLSGEKKAAALAGLVSLFPVFYTSFLGTTDSFGILMVFGTIFFLLIKDTRKIWKFFLLGLIVGFIHLSRADGLLWLVVAGLSVLADPGTKTRAFILLGAGYLCIMGPWFVRNMIVIGEIMPSGTSRMFWLTEYNDLFTYYPEKLTITNWYKRGILVILRDLLSALSTNLKTALIVEGQIILVPLIGMGIKKTWKEKTIRYAILIWGLIFFVMTIVFPFAGARGGLFHSGAAIQPVFWALAVIGLREIIDWGVRKRGWINGQAEVIFGISLIIFLAGMTTFVVADRVVGQDFSEPQWNRSFKIAQGIGRELNKMNIPDDSLLMINNPPGLYIATDRSAIVIPSNGIESVLAAAEKYSAEILILEENHPVAMDYLYINPLVEERLDLIQTVSNVHYFRIR